MNVQDFLKHENGRGGDTCGMFLNMLLGNVTGNYLFVRPGWRYNGKGIKAGVMGGRMAVSYDVCGKLGMWYDGRADREFNENIKKIALDMKALSFKQQAFSRYLEKLSKNVLRQSDFFADRI